MDGKFEASQVASPALYDRYVGPLLMAPYAADLARRVAGRAAGRVLELACGTGIVTRALDAALAPAVEIVATDLDPEMLAAAREITGPTRIAWRIADAQDLPFADREFDAVLCQFGAMFFPDRPAAFRQARRVLRPGGRFILNVWDSLAANELQDVVARALAGLFPGHAARFTERAAFCCHDRAALRQQCRAAGFAAVKGETVALTARAPSAGEAATAFCRGSGFGAEVVALDPGRFDEATQAVTDALAARFGAGPIEAGMRAHVVTARR